MSDLFVQYISMNNPDFEIKIIDLYWLEHIDDPVDLCAHGHVYVRIKDEILSDKDSLEITISATALYLMRTLKNNYKKNDYASQLLPCCGHFITIDDNQEDRVHIHGCLSGIDWTIIHTEDGKVKHTSESGKVAMIDRETYREMVLAFADEVEDFYKKSLPKNLPEDKFDRSAYLTFWKEWRNLRDEWK